MAVHVNVDNFVRAETDRMSVDNGAGYFEPNDRNSYSINNITGVANSDGSVTVRFGDFPAGTPNAIPTPEGRNYLIRLHRPRAEILDGTWTPTATSPAELTR